MSAVAVATRTRAALAENARFRAACTSTANTLTPFLFGHGDGFDFPIGTDRDQLHMANDSLRAARHQHFTQFDLAVYFCW